MTNVNLPACICAAVAVVLCCGGAVAQTISDPTRPPGAVAPAESDADQPRAPVLQSVIITPKQRAAIINGQRVELGGRYGSARVLKITENEVVLRSAGGTEVLKMYPNVDKAAKRVEPSKAPSTVTRSQSTKE